MQCKARTIYVLTMTSEGPVRMPFDGYDVGTGIGVYDSHDPRTETGRERARRTKSHQWRLVDIATGCGFLGTRTFATRKEAVAVCDEAFRVKVRDLRMQDSYAERKAEADLEVCGIMEDAERWSHPEPEQPRLALVEQQPEPSQAKPKPETRPERFNREFGEAYDAILRLQEEYNPGHPEHVTDSGAEWNDLSVAIRALTLVGERFMREHPRMLGKFCKWRGDMFTSDREVAALGMVGTRWLEETERRRAEQTA